jgi:hypothetical protein
MGRLVPPGMEKLIFKKYEGPLIFVPVLLVAYQERLRVMAL